MLRISGSVLRRQRSAFLHRLVVRPQQQRPNLDALPGLAVLKLLILKSGVRADSRCAVIVVALEDQHLICCLLKFVAPSVIWIGLYRHRFSDFCETSVRTRTQIRVGHGLSINDAKWVFADRVDRAPSLFKKTVSKVPLNRQSIRIEVRMETHIYDNNSSVEKVFGILGNPFVQNVAT